MLDFALAYATPNGTRPAWNIFPLSAGTKIPLPGSQGCTEATTDKTTITKWWTAHPAANIGIACGQVNGFVVIDIDAHKDDEDGAEAFQFQPDRLHLPLEAAETHAGIDEHASGLGKRILGDLQEEGAVAAAAGCETDEPDHGLGSSAQ